MCKTTFCTVCIWEGRGDSCGFTERLFSRRAGNGGAVGRLFRRLCAGAVSAPVTPSCDISSGGRREFLSFKQAKAGRREQQQMGMQRKKEAVRRPQGKRTE